MKHAMRDLVCLLLLLGVMAICSRSWAQAPASLVVTSDMDCNWKLDGVEQARLSADDANVIKNDRRRAPDTGDLARRAGKVAGNRYR
jgi:hypothetical protein